MHLLDEPIDVRIACRENDHLLPHLGPLADFAGNQVLDSIDTMLRQLHQLRARMVTEYRADQDIAAARADALLEQCRQQHQEGES